MKTITQLSVLILLAALAASPVRAQEGSRPPAGAPRQDIVPPPPPAEGDYTISRQDVLSIVVLDQPTLTNKYTVDLDGTIRFPFLDRVMAAGLTLREFEGALKKGLSPAYLRNPQVVVSLDQFKGRRIFVWGAAGTGMYPLGDGETLVEVLVKVGAANQSEAVIIRPRNPGPNIRMLSPSTTDADVIPVNVREFEKEASQGNFSRNVQLQDGDTVYLPRVDKNRVFVTGQVKSPNAYSVPEGTTVQQLIAIAGGLTPQGTTRGVRIQRIVDGKSKEVKVKLNEVVHPGDTVIVGERLF